MPAEAFIPFRRTDLIDLCLADEHFSVEEAASFRQFCEILAAFYHFRSQTLLESLKNRFAPFNPDADTRIIHQPNAAQRQEMAAVLTTDFETLLKRANYLPFSRGDLEESFEAASLIPLRTKVDFDDFDQVLFFYRGEGEKEVTLKHLWRKKTLVVNNFERVAVLLKFKDQEYFDQKEEKPVKHDFEPGKIYLYLYKNIPRYDLELLFPNIQVSMNLKDRLLLVVPALGAAVPLLIKVLPSLGLLVAAVLLLTMGPEITRNMGFKAEGPANLYPVLLAVLSIGATLGGFAVRQYTKYKSKRLEFLKKVTDTLFFKNLVTNEGVLYSLADSAEEEVCKEIILVYYHLLTGGNRLTRHELDARIETWMQERFGAVIDFDIDKTLDNLSDMKAELTDVNGQSHEYALLTRQEDQTLSALPLIEAKRVIDDIWDNAFAYAEQI